jgi:anti-sigma-K factor RskA
LKHDAITEEEQETAALYALGALCQHDSRAFEQHLLEGCSVCEAENRSFERVAEALGSVESVDPPAYIRDLLTSRVQREQPGATSRTASVLPFETRRSAATQQPPDRKTDWNRVLSWAAAALLVAAFGAGLLAWQADRRALQSQAREEMDTALEERNRALIDIHRQNSELQAVNQALTSPGARTISLSGQDVAPNASAKIYWEVASNRWVVTAELPPAPAGKVYQLWFVTKDEKISAGLIKPDARGHGFAVVPVPASGAQLAAAAITLEPETGSPQPTMPIYVLGKPS